MKTNIIKLAMAALVAFSAVSFTACDKTEDDDPIHSGDLLPDKPGQWTVDGNKYTFTITEDGFNQTYELWFNENDNCSKNVITYEYATEEIAKESFRVYERGGLTDDNIQLKGKKIIYTDSSTYYDIDRATLALGFATLFPNSEPMPDKPNTGGKDDDGNGNEDDYDDVDSSLLINEPGVWTVDGNKYTFTITETGTRQTYELWFDEEGKCTENAATFEYASIKGTQAGLEALETAGFTDIDVNVDEKRISYTNAEMYMGKDQAFFATLFATLFAGSDPMPGIKEEGNNDDENQGGNNDEGQGGSIDTDIDYSGVNLEDANKDNYSALIKREFGVEISEEDGFELVWADPISGSDNNVFIKTNIDLRKITIHDLVKLYYDRMMAATETDVYYLVTHPDDDEAPSELVKITDIEGFTEKWITDYEAGTGYDSKTLYYKHDGQYKEVTFTYRGMTDIKSIFNVSFRVNDYTNEWISWGVYVIAD